MTTAAEATAAPLHAQPQVPARPAHKQWQPWALAMIVTLSAVLYAWNIGSRGWGNSFYTAGVKSMSESLTNFVFGAFDPAGVVTVDKPPMGLWPQVVSVWIFGWHSWAVLLPQVVEGAAAVFLLHRTVRRWAGENAALLAALALALTPITVAIDRYNNPDTMLMLLCVLAGYAFTRSVENGIPARSATKWLLQAAFWVGCGFLTKSLAAWMIVPALGVGYLFGRNASWGRRAVDLLAAGGVLLASSFWWVLLTVVWPGPKPYVGGSTDGSELSLIFGYNGLGRVFGENLGHGDAAGGHGGGGQAAGHTGGGGMGGMGGDQGIGRMFSDRVGGQISWLMPLCLFVLAVVAVAGVIKWRRKLAADHQVRAGWLLWGAWMVVLSAVFSSQQGIFNPYYTTQMAPAVAALAGAGLVLLWRHYREANGYGWLLLPAGIGLTAVWAWVLVSRDPSWNGWLRYAVAAVAALAVIGLVIARLASPAVGATARVAAVFGLVAVLLAPGVWSAASATAGTGGAMTAGPPGNGFGGRGGHGGGFQIPGGPDLSGKQVEQLANQFGKSQAGLTPEQRKILAYVTSHAGSATIVLAVEGGAMGGSANYIINSNATIIGMGGFRGSDPAPSLDQLSQWRQQGNLAFVLTSAPGARQDSGKGGFFGGNAVEEQRTQWVRSNCAVIPPGVYGGSPVSSDKGGLRGFPGVDNQTLYSCLGKSKEGRR